MSAIKQILLPAHKHAYLIRPSLSRVVSTSPRADQGALAIPVESALPVEAAAVGQCPFRKSMTAFSGAMAPRVSEPEAAPAVQPFSALPGPGGLPIVGTFFDYIKKDGLKFTKMHEVFRDRAKQFGSMYYENVGGPLGFHAVVISSPQIYQKFVQTEGKFPNRREMTPIAHYRKERGLDLGIVNSQNEEWYKQRTLVSKKMLKLNEVNSFSGEMGDVADDFVLRLDSVRDVNGEIPQLERELFKWTMESIGTFLFEERIGCLNPQPSEISTSFLDNMVGFFKTLQPLLYNLPIYKLYKTSLWREFEGYSDNIMRIGQSMIQKKMAEIKAGNAGGSSAMLTYLCNSDMTAKEITGLFVDLLTAAVETTSTATTWCLYLLAKHPEVQERLLTEINAASGEDGQLSAQELGQLPYVRSVVKEVLRMYPIVYSTSRNMTEDKEIGGYNIPKGTHVQANLYGMYHDADLFTDPESFKPERWLRENAKEMDPSVKAMGNLVWGHGARMCLGRRFAEQEMHITLSKIIQKFSLSYEHEDVEPVLNVMLTPDRPMKIKMTPRA